MTNQEPSCLHDKGNRWIAIREGEYPVRVVYKEASPVCPFCKPTPNAQAEISKERLIKQLHSLEHLTYAEVAEKILADHEAAMKALQFSKAIVESERDTLRHIGNERYDEVKALEAAVKERDAEIAKLKEIVNQQIFKPSTPLDALSYSELQDQLKEKDSRIAELESAPLNLKGIVETNKKIAELEAEIKDRHANHQSFAADTLAEDEVNDKKIAGLEKELKITNENLTKSAVELSEAKEKAHTLEKYYQGAIQRANQAETNYYQAKADLAALHSKLKALKKYIRHDSLCNSEPTDKCICGLTKALAQDNGNTTNSD